MEACAPISEDPILVWQLGNVKAAAGLFGVTVRYVFWLRFGGQWGLVRLSII